MNTEAPADDGENQVGSVVAIKGDRVDSIKKAVALAYRPDSEEAPRVTAQALGELAEIMIELALKNGVPVVNNQDLVEFLTEIRLGELVPVHVYEAVALIYSSLNSYANNSHDAPRE